ncbi:ankyrin repeat domain-containing protein [Sphingomonas sp. 1P06PA]|uniref:ankyrin repeat domain-containing protein n=1 Tax=Sphingomonas sp. 1P06PA TaxID=554121 RepID=UPI0039A5FAFE
MQAIDGTIAVVRTKWVKAGGAMLAALVMGLASTPAAAQFSDSYNFLKAVRDGDGTKVTDLLNKPGSTIVNTRDQSTGDAAIHIVTRRRDTTWLNFLLSRGARADARDEAGNTPLMLAAQLGFVEGAEALIRRRGGINLANNAGETPLIAAVQRRDIGMVRLLLTNGANAAQTDRIAGKSARDYAAEDRRSAAILKMIDDTKAKPAAGPAGPTL